VISELRAAQGGRPVSAERAAFTNFRADPISRIAHGPEMVDRNFSRRNGQPFAVSQDLCGGPIFAQWNDEFRFPRREG